MDIDNRLGMKIVEFGASLADQVRGFRLLMAEPKERWKLRDGAASGTPIQSDAAPRYDVNSDEFNSWFEGSVMVTETGAPRVFYHGTFRDFEEFTTTQREWVGSYFTSVESDAWSYGYNVMEVHLRVCKPFLVQEYIDVAIVSAEVRESLRRGGYDALVYTGAGDDRTELREVCVFSPSQIKLLKRTNIGKWGGNGHD